MAYQALFNAKSILLEKQKWYYLTNSKEEKEIQTFSNSNCPKMNIIARLEFEFSNYNCPVHSLNHYTTWTRPGR